jgi:mono/diheme cytochrome c family protein
MMTLRFVIAACLLAAGVQAADQPGLLRPFLKTYCVQCHGPEKQKGDRRFDILTGNFTKLAEAESFQEILDQLNLDEMPPEGKKQPTPAEVKRVVAHLTQSLARARGGP